MTLPLDDFVSPDAHPSDFRRDRWGRPSIMQPDGKRKGYTRCSSAAKTIEDTFNLEKWARRNIAYGMAYDSSLIARIIAIGGDPSTWTKDEKEQVNAILEAADLVAKAHKAADIGTAVHHLTHRVDRGETVNAGPYQADIDAYIYAMNQCGMYTTPEWIECRMVNDDLEMAGTADRLLAGEGSKVRVADIKTGATIDFGGLGWSAQLAAYAGSLLYDTDLEQRLPTPPIDRDIGYIIHLPAGQGRCDIYEVDIAQGLIAARLANDIRATRKASKTWIVPASSSTPPPPSTPTSSSSVQTSTTSSTNSTIEGSAGAISPRPPSNSPTTPSSTDGWRFEAKRRYDALSDAERLAYTERKRTIDTTDPAAVFALLDEIDAFAAVKIAPEPGLDSPPAPVQPPPDEGGPVTPNDVRYLIVRFDNLGTEAQLWLGTLVSQGRRQGFDWRIKDRPTVRRYELYRAVLALAEWAFGGEG